LKEGYTDNLNTNQEGNSVQAQDLPSVNSAIWPGPLKLGKKKLWRRLGPLIWAWIIIIGGLMITSGGVSCPKCSAGLTDLLGIVSIVLGVLGFVSRVVESRVATQRVAPPRIDAKADLHS
jgi:hypothetical protein